MLLAVRVMIVEVSVKALIKNATRKNLPNWLEETRKIHDHIEWDKLAGGGQKYRVSAKFD